MANQYLNPKSYSLKPNIGHSLKDLGKKIFGFSKIDVSLIKEIIKL